MKKSAIPVSALTILGIIFQGLLPSRLALGDAVSPPPIGNVSFPGADPAAMNMQLVVNQVQTAMAACAQKSQASRVGAFFEKTGALSSLAGLASRDTRKEAGKDLFLAASGTKPEGTCYSALQKKDSAKKGEKDEFGNPKFDGSLMSELTKSQSSCLMDCPPPEEDASGCFDFFGSPGVSGKYDGKQQREGRARIDMVSQKIRIYRAFQEFKMNACANQEEIEIRVAQELYQCQQRALSEAVSFASLQLQNALNEHKMGFDKMSQMNRELFQQWVDINVALGAKDPDEDPLFNMGDSKNQSNQFGGLLAIQRGLNDALTEQETKGADFKKQVDELKQSIQANNDNLERGRMESVAGCMNQSNSIGVSGGRALMCFKPMKDKDGNPALDANGNPQNVQMPCGPMEFLKTQVEQSAFKTSRGNIVLSQNRREESQRLGLEFQNIADSILQELKPAAGDGEVLVPDTTTWGEISEKFGPALNELSKTSKVDLMGQLQKVASFCFQTGDRWKRQQVRSVSSAYGKAKAANDQKRSELNGELQKGLEELKKNYGDAIAVLVNQAVALNTSNCTKTDPQKMLDCYDQIRSSTRDLLEGTGTSATVIRNAKGQPIAPACKGINGCVTVLNQARKTKKGQVQEGRRIQANFAVQAKAKIDQSVLSLANLLKGLQGQVASQFGVVAGLANRLGVKANASPKMVEGVEALQPMENDPGPPPTGPGPYKFPSDMAKVLSGRMMPGGMINFSDDGMGDVVADAMEKIKEKKEKVKEELSKVKDNSKEIQDLAKSCIGDKDNVGNGACDPYFCSKIKLCEGDDDKLKQIASLASLSKLTTGNERVDSEVAQDYEAALENLGGVDCSGQDDLIANVCYNCISSKSAKFSDDIKERYKRSDSANTSSGGTGGGSTGGATGGTN